MTIEIADVVAETVEEELTSPIWTLFAVAVATDEFGCSALRSVDSSGAALMCTCRFT